MDLYRKFNEINETNDLNFDISKRSIFWLMNWIFLFEHLALVKQKIPSKIPTKQKYGIE